MWVLQAKGLMKEFGGEPLFENIDVEIAEGERVALFGRNGTGKTTLLNALLGRIELDEGTIRRGVPVSEWGLLEQHFDPGDRMTVLTLAQTGVPTLADAKRALEEAQAALGGGGSVGAAEEALLEKYGAAHDRYVELGGYEWELRVEQCLRRLGLGPELWEQPYARLSGGQKTKAQLARLMIAEPKFLLLDEPTNHLDRDTMEWLEGWLVSYPGTVLLVSHDRYFLDRTVQAVLELSAEGCRRYAGGYADYRRQKELERRSREAEYRKQEREKEELLESIRRYQTWFQIAHRDAGKDKEDAITTPFWRARANKNMTRFKAKEKALERLEANRTEKPRDTPQLRMDLGEGDFSPATLIRMEDVSFGYGHESLFRELTLSVNRGDRIAVIGANGAGKTTLLRLLLGELEPMGGAIAANPQVRIGYFSQELEGLSGDETVLDSLLVLPDMTQSFARTILGCFLFSRDDVFKRIADLSSGEKCRVAFLRLYFSRANLLVLDEPTNYLDIDTREKIEEALAAYPGAFLLVSHDRYLTAKAANRIIELRCGDVRQFDGGYDEYVESERRRQQAEKLAGGREAAAEVQRIEMELVRLMAAEAPADLEENRRQMEAIRSLRRRLDELKE